MSPTLQTNTGHRLSVKEAKFIDEYVKTGNGRKSVIEAGYAVKDPESYAHELTKKPHIGDEIRFRMSQLQKSSIADADEILQYFTSVMRGETADQFGLEAPLSERTRAAQELAKRQIDIPNRLAGKADNAVVIKLVRDYD